MLDVAQARLFRQRKAAQLSWIVGRRLIMKLLPVNVAAGDEDAGNRRLGFLDRILCRWVQTSNGRGRSVLIGGVASGNREGYDHCADCQQETRHEKPWRWHTRKARDSEEL